MLTGFVLWIIVNTTPGTWQDSGMLFPSLQACTAAATILVDNPFSPVAQGACLPIGLHPMLAQANT